MVNFGRALCGSGDRPREANDFYPTPKEATIALIKAEGEFFPKRVWEPACGKGDMAEVMVAAGIEVLATDLNEYGYGRSGLNFLECDISHGSNIVTNPPFNLAEAFIRKAHSFSNLEYLALLLKATFWHPKKRTKLFYEHQPSHIYALNWRLDFLGQGSPAMDCIWCVWDAKAPRDTTYAILEKP